MKNSLLSELRALINFLNAPAAVAVFTLCLVLSTLGLCLATVSLASTDRRHDEDGWQQIVDEQVSILQKAIESHPGRKSCARYVIATDVANGITAERAGIHARRNTTARIPHSQSELKAWASAVRSKTTNSLLAAVWGSAPIANSEALVPIDSPLARACFAPILVGRPSPPSVYARVTYLSRQIIGYQNALEAVSSFLKNSDLPIKAQNSLKDEINGSVDNDTRLFFEATIVYYTAEDNHSGHPIKWSNVKKEETEQFDTCNAIGGCFVKRDIPSLFGPKRARDMLKAIRIGPASLNEASLN